MTDAQKGALRSLGRTILFAAVPVILTTEFLSAWMPPEYAATVVVVVGAVLRAVFPNVLGTRPPK